MDSPFITFALGFGAGAFSILVLAVGPELYRIVKQRLRDFLDEWPG
jgi:hypothetical protein